MDIQSNFVDIQGQYLDIQRQHSNILRQILPLVAVVACAAGWWGGSSVSHVVHYPVGLPSSDLQ